MNVSGGPDGVGARLGQTLVNCLIVAVVVFVVAYGGIELTRGTGRIATIWGANAVFLVGLLTAPLGRLPYLMAAGFLGNLAANVLTGDTLAIGLGLPIINLVEVVICYIGLRRFGDHDLTRPRTLMFFVALAVGPASAISSILAASLFAASGKAEFGPLLETWYAADALGLITFTPLFASMAEARIVGPVTRWRLVEVGGAAAAFALVTGLVFYQSAYPLLFVVFPALTFVAFRFGFLGSSIALAFTALIAVVATAGGHGPLSLVNGSLREKIVILQAFIAISAFTSLQVTAVLAERRRLSDQLQRSKAETETSNTLLVLAEQVAQVGHWRYAVATGELTWSDEVFRMHGRNPALGPPDVDDAISAYHSDDRAEVRQLLAAAMAEQAPFVFKLRLVREDGEIRTVFSRGLCETGPDGTVQTVFGTIADLTDLTRAEEAVRVSEKRFRLLAENASELFILGHDDGRRSYISPASIRLLGFAPDELAAMSLHDYVHPEDLAALKATTRRLGAGDQEASLVYRALHKERGWIIIEGTFRRAADARGDEPTIVATFRDVTEREAQAGLVESARAAAEDALAVKSRFLALMSHELRTPLSAIIGFSNLIAESGELGSEQGRRFVRNIQTSSRALLAIVNDVLDVSKIEAGAVELDPQPFALRALCEDMAAIVQGQADEKGLALAVEVDGRLPERFVGDDARLRQVLLNLLSNAVKFTAKGKITLRAGRTADGALRISVSDTGIGIPEARRDRLFKAFSQVDATTSRRFGGTGLGLSICKSLLDMMGSDIMVESRDGAGSTFSFVLRLPEAEPPAETSDDVSVSSFRDHGPLRILVAEDVALNQELLATLLGRWGHGADIVSDGVQAVDAAGRTRYDLIFMDVQMPVMDGLEATRRIRMLDAPSRHVPIVALTANVLPQDIDAFLAAGMDGHVAKPFDPEDLKLAIAKFGRRAELVAGAPADPPAVAADFDRDRVDELRRLVGAASVDSFLVRLGEQMDESFAAAPLGPDEMAAIRYQAHALASTSGMLGFAALSDACITLEGACRERDATPGSIIPALADALAARARARSLLDRLIMAGAAHA